MLRKRLGSKTFEVDALRLRDQFGQAGMPPGTGAWDWYRIWVVHFDGSKPEDFDVTDAGLAAAILVAATRDTILIPPATFASDYVFPATVKVHGAGSISTYFTGQITAPAGGYMRDLRIQRTANDANLLRGLIVPDTGVLSVNTIVIDLTQSGSGDARGIECNMGGEIVARDGADPRGTYIEVNTASGMAAAVHCELGRIQTHDSDLYGISATGLGYAATFTRPGYVRLIDGIAHGSTDVTAEI